MSINRIRFVAGMALLGAWLSLGAEDAAARPATQSKTEAATRSATEAGPAPGRSLAEPATKAVRKILALRAESAESLTQTQYQHQLLCCARFQGHRGPQSAGGRVER